MRKAIAIVIAAGLVFGALGAPATAAKKKKKKTVTEEWDPAGLPYPATTADETCGVEGVHYVTHPFTTPGKGVLEVSLGAYQGDWDLYVYDGSGGLLGSSTGFVDVPEEVVTIALPKKFDIVVHTCNYLGGPAAHAVLTYVYKA